QLEPSNVPKPETVEPNVLASEKILMAPFKRKKKDQIKITGTTRLCYLFDEDSNDKEEDLDEDSSDQEEDLEKDLDEDLSDQAEDLYEDSSDPDVLYDEDSIDLEEYLGLFDESDQEEDLGEDDSDDGWF
nr:concanavalin A-like lectin/glucanase domain-containing protein [Tanacetum cinerariifolium]